ncbi:protein RIK [Quillaja saponaria]|uniref:Protein RIK n=1 Tax=Quillaja saponaria TaxID=32244 RepID=A0AAD7VFU5_QUISA|nr:protein RIK [Quillaja saponaria]
MIEKDGSRVSNEESSVSNDSSQTRQRRKRKWDQPAESLISTGLTVPLVLSLGNVGSLGGVAVPGVASVSSSLLTNPLLTMPQAILAPSVQQQNSAVLQKLNLPKIQDELIIAREIVINDAESSVRYKLTKRQTQEEIQRCTGAVVITRGKYRPPNAPPDGEKPLYLHISAGAHLKDTAERILVVDRAAAMVEEMLKQGHTSVSIPSTFHPAVASGVKVTQVLSTCVFLGFDAEPSLNIVARIRGPNDQYINHIMNETGATVTLRGHDSGNIEGLSGEDGQQPLHLFLSSNNPKSLEDAKCLAENLLDTISVECGTSRVSSCKVYSAVPPSQQVHSGISPSLQVYSAVPPPQQLLAGVDSSGIDLKASTSSATSLTSSSTVGSTPVPSVLPIAAPGVATIIPQVTLPQSGGYVNCGQPQANMISYTPPLVSGGTSYIGYGGLYPQATALQQVALALRNSSSVASAVAPTSVASAVASTSVASAVASATSVLSKSTSSDPDKEKQPPQRRKFQELPVRSKSATKLNQGSESIESFGLVTRNMSNMPAPRKLIKPLSNGMPPPPPRAMPPLPPPPKFPSTTPDVKMLDKRKNLNKTISDTVPDTLVKLMEYGEEDDDDTEDTSDKPLGGVSPAVAAQKPFWAI